MVEGRQELTGSQSCKRSACWFFHGSESSWSLRGRGRKALALFRKLEVRAFGADHDATC